MKRPLNYINIYFQIHQPRRLRPFSFFDLGSNENYFDDDLNRDIIRRITRTCYLPVNYLLLRLTRRYPHLRFTFSITGSALDQFERYSPAVLETFKMLAATGSVDFMTETDNHSLAFMTSREEFTAQVNRHRERIRKTFGIEPKVFRNTELMYTDYLGKWVSRMGFKGVFVDGVDRLLQFRSPHQVFRHPEVNGLRLLLRDYRPGDDIAFRFSQQSWDGWPVTPEKFTNSLRDSQDGALINIGLDYETFGEHQRPETGIYEFLENTLIALATDKSVKPVSASEALGVMTPKEPFSVPEYISWADRERDLSAWLGNDMQRDAFDFLYTMERAVKKLNIPEFNAIWSDLQTSDHFYYMSTKKDDDGNVHGYFSHYPSPYEAFLNYMNVVKDFSRRIDIAKRARREQLRQSLEASSLRQLPGKDKIAFPDLKPMARASRSVGEVKVVGK